MSSELPPAQRDLTQATRVSPAEQDRRRGEVELSGTAFYQDRIRLPGFGEKPERCRPYRPVAFCRQNGHVVLGQSSCQSRGCPDHWRDWLEDGVVDDVARLAAYRHAQEGWGKRLIHIVLSPEQDRRWTARQVWETRSEAYDVAEAVGIRGGRLFVHPYRTTEHADAIFETAVEHGDVEPSDGKWKALRRIADDWEEMARYTQPAPHYHGLVACRDFDPDAVPEDWVVKNVRSLPRFDHRDVETYRPMARVAWYIRSHCGVQRGRHAVSWFGDVHPASFNPAEDLPLAVWSTIQDMAERAVGESGDGAGVEECPREGCESPVEPIRVLDEFMNDDEWWNALDPEQRARLRGVRLWLTELDRPPPGRLASKGSLRSWLDHAGGVAGRARRRSDATIQTAL